jgi:hypothetical protein
VIDRPPSMMAGKTSAFCDFADAGDESVLATCSGNVVQIIDAWRQISMRGVTATRCTVLVSS